MTLPEGFRVTLFAGEPDVAQPIALALDDRGRLWVAECYSYPDWLAEGKEGRDRILIFEDSDGDGRFDARRVFWDRAANLSGLEIGFGGVWLCSTPNLLFLPDRDGDDLPDGPPEALLDGFSLEAKHNVFNGLTWGPDGWLYGMNGILATARVGRPGTPDAERVRINCGVWRYHPLRRTFEVVAHGTTNPWGMDFNEHGQLFITNCVIPHLWHVVPGAHFQRMFGEDFNPHLYELMGTCADHLHWAGGPWQDSRGGVGQHGAAGGGHAHSGAMIYLGDNWPERYRGTLFTCNIHGNRVNNDLLERRGSGYLARHGKDFLLANDSWFRGLALTYGPDGGVYLCDWTDSGECHDYDQVDRSNGRIYKIVYGEPPRARVDLGKLPDEELVKLQSHRNEWFARHARRLLQERAAAGRDLRAVHRPLLDLFRTSNAAAGKLRALWALGASGGLEESILLQALGDPMEEVRGWAVRLLCESGDPPAAALEAFARLAREDPSPLSRLHLASALERVPRQARWDIAGPLAGRTEDAADPNLPFLIWYGIESLVPLDVERSLALLSRARIPFVRSSIARRLAASLTLDPLAKLLLASDGAALEIDVLRGMHQALQGRTDLPPPECWPAVLARLERSGSEEVVEEARTLSVIFGSREAIETLRGVLADPLAPAARRERALQALLVKRDADLLARLRELLGDRQLRRAALRALASFDDPATPGVILARYADCGEAEKADAISTLASRPSFALALLQAIEEKRVPARDLSAFTVRQMEELGERRVVEKLRSVWGASRSASGDKASLMARYRGLLSPGALKDADRSRGRAVFERTCASCHTLFGSGTKIGPDLTGSQRANLDYLLENLLDPSALVGRDYQLSVIGLRDGRLLTGIVLKEDDHSAAIQTANESLVLPKKEIRTRERSDLSMMPEGLLEKLADAEVLDLTAYLAGTDQVPRAE
jgi:putative membrane-bound dehydrogenase-like protein